MMNWDESVKSITLDINLKESIYKKVEKGEQNLNRITTKLVTKMLKKYY